jgi:hypothetical protein
MNGREALKALLDGKKVRAVNDKRGIYLVLRPDGRIYMHNGDRWGDMHELLTLAVVDFVEYEAATDAELVAEFERLSDSNHGRVGTATAAYLACAEMLRTREIK